MISVSNNLKVLWSQRASSIFWDADNDFIIWQPVGYLTHEEFVLFTDKFVAEGKRLSKTHPRIAILGDNREAEAIRDETTDYITKTIFNNLSGLIRKQALVLSGSIFSVLAVEQYADSPEAHNSEMPTQIFSDIDLAIHWLQQA